MIKNVGGCENQVCRLRRVIKLGRLKEDSSIQKILCQKHEVFYDATANIYNPPCSNILEVQAEGTSRINLRFLGIFRP